MRLELGEGTKEIVDADRNLDIRANFIPEDQAMSRYLNRGFGNSYDFNQTP